MRASAVLRLDLRRRHLNNDLVADGYAEAIRVRPNDTYWPLLRQTGEQARAARRGAPAPQQKRNNRSVR